jgi:hypothetical protein
MIKKLRNQPYAPKDEQATKWEQRKLKKKLNFVACSPQANFTDRAAAAC